MLKMNSTYNFTLHIIFGDPHTVEDTPIGEKVVQWSGPLPDPYFWPFPHGSPPPSGSGVGGSPKIYFKGKIGRRIHFWHQNRAWATHKTEKMITFYDFSIFTNVCKRERVKENPTFFWLQFYKQKNEPLRPPKIFTMSIFQKNAL